MGKTFIIIGAKAISNSLTQVLEMFVSYDFLHLDPSDFAGVHSLISELEKHKDDVDIKGFIVSEPDGVEIAKHLRLTVQLQNLRILPLIVITPESISYLLSNKRDNIFLLSKKCYPLQVSNCMPELLSVLDEPDGFASMEQMQEGIRPFVIWSEEDDVISSHDNFNRYGPFKFMQELFAGLPEFMSAQYGDISSRLWFKKYRFLESNSISTEAVLVDEELFRKTIANKKILYIDDEHRGGWSFVLSSLFTGNSDMDHYQLFQDAATLISTPDKRVTCIDDVQEAMRVIEAYNDTLSGALAAYSHAEQLRNRLTEKTSEQRKIVREMEVSFERSESNLSRSEASLRETEERMKDINNRLKKASEDLLEAYTKRTGDVEISDVLPQIKEMSDIHARFAQEGIVFSKYQDEYKRGKEIFEKQKIALERQKPLLEETETANSAAIKLYDESIRALSPGKLFPYDLIVLDLRLERLKDKDRLPHEISGVTILRQIKEVDPSIPVLMFTASEKAINYEQARDLGASGYWIKAVNSLPALKSEIIKSLAKSQEARNIWNAIRRVEAKKQLTYIRENAGHLEKGIISDTKKAEIILLLKESFLLFIKELTPYEQSVHKYTHHRKIVLNMGMIQEERFSRLQDKRWDYWVNRKAREIDKDEVTIRQLRNRAAHTSGTGITYQEALGVFQKTLERCLRN